MSKQTAKAVSRDLYARLGQEVEQTLRNQHLACWYPRTMDLDGGFHQNFSRTWRQSQKGPKTLVYQARGTWMAATVAHSRPDLRDEYLRYARHGADFLIERMWDQHLGGFWWQLDEGNRQPTSPKHEKHIYGNAFAIYALAAAHKATGKVAYRTAATKTFRWLEEHARDRGFGGYIESLYADGTPMLSRPEGVSPRPKWSRIQSWYGLKTMNSHIHMLEAYAELYHVWPDKLLGQHIEHLLDILLTKIISPRHTQHQFLKRDWTPAGTDEISFGHDVETVFLLLEAAQSIDRGSDCRFLEVGKAMLDTSLKYGWDSKSGGIFYEGEYAGHVTNTNKEWWPQVECLNALLLMHDLVGRKDGSYWDPFVRQWRFITDHMIDPQYGGLYQKVTADGRTVLQDTKASKWKCCYHDGRSFLRVANRLNELARA